MDTAADFNPLWPSDSLIYNIQTGTSHYNLSGNLGPALSSGLKPWAANQYYPANWMVSNASKTFVRITAGVSRPSFDPTEQALWTCISNTIPDGLNNVDNTSDANKPVSTAQATADTAVANAASSDATSKANTAQSNAISTASSDATTKADTAQSAAISAASTDATTKANSAQSAAIASASTDATSKANAAQSNAISASATDATSKANTAQASAQSFATSADNVVLAARPISNITAADYTLQASSSLTFQSDYEIGNTFVTEIGTDSILAVE